MPLRPHVNCVHCHARIDKPKRDALLTPDGYTCRNCGPDGPIILARIVAFDKASVFFRVYYSRREYELTRREPDKRVTFASIPQGGCDPKTAELLRAFVAQAK